MIIKMSDDSGANNEVNVPDETSKDEIENEVEEWIRGGEWGDGKHICSAEYETDNGFSGNVTIEVGEDDDPPDCAEGQEHSWESPQWLGGCTENPGVWSIEGNRILSKEVCSICGIYKNYQSEDQNGREPNKTWYEDADEYSIEWTNKLKKDIP